MEQVYQCAQALADAILASEVYGKMKDAKDALEHIAEDREDFPELERFRTARQRFDDMMENINRILRLTINGDPGGEEEAPARCAGCAGCQGCGRSGDCGGCARR